MSLSDILDRELSRLRTRLLDEMFEYQLREMDAELGAWKLILAAKGDVPITIAPIYGVER